MSSQFALLGQRRFAGLFFTQFFGAFNDNLFKSAIMLIFVYGGLVASEQANIVVNAAAGLFILPFFLFSALAGQLADKYEKSRLVRLIKLVEIVICVLGAVAVYFNSVAGMLSVLFLLGVQSTFFGPLKYSILPQQLAEHELIGGNAQIEMGTFVSILLGTVVGGVVATQGSDAALWLACLVVLMALIGYFSSRFIPTTPATSPELVVGWNLVKETGKLIRLARADNAVFLSIMGISWFWLLGSAFLSQIPKLTQDYLAGGATVVTLILAIFTISIALGSLACERLSGKVIEIGLVPFGSIGITLAGIDLFFAIQGLPLAESREWLDFLGAPGTTRVLFDLSLIGFFGGMFIVPLYAFIQVRTPEAQRARIIAVNNIINAIFMVFASLVAILLIGVAGLGIPDFLFMLVLMNIAVTWFIFYQVPDFTMRFLVWLLSHSMYRVTHKNLDNIPESGAALLVCNHVTFVDALVLAGAVRRPIRFIMFKPIYDIPILNFVFRTCRTIPIVGRSADEAAYLEAFAKIKQGLEAGDLLCIFPEGALTQDGEIAEFRRGVERILEETPVPVVPMALQGFWESFFSHSRGVFNPRKMFRRLWSRVSVVAGEVVPPEQATAALLQQRVEALRGEHR